ncbi:MAG TPA: HAD family hydrolase [Ureibacillus sp.]|nr:HAD family hydrolase [Ureibacillus sp.]
MKFIFDIDGTVCFDGRTIDESICRAFDEITSANHEIIFASARPIRDLIPVLPEPFRNGSMVGGNGTFVFDQGKIKVEFLQGDVLKQLLDCIETNQLTYLADSEWDYAYTGDTDHPIYRNIDKTSAKNREINDLQTICKLVLFNPTEQVLQELSQLPVSIVHYKNENAIDISPLGVNKVSGLRKLNIDQFIAFGNDSNDQCLFEHALHSVCIGNNDVKRYATETINRENIPDTIRRILERLEEQKYEKPDKVKTW